jgi:hypothetical protein
MNRILPAWLIVALTFTVGCASRPVVRPAAASAAQPIAVPPVRRAPPQSELCRSNPNFVGVRQVREGDVLIFDFEHTEVPDVELLDGVLGHHEFVVCGKHRHERFEMEAELDFVANIESVPCLLDYTESFSFTVTGAQLNGASTSDLVASAREQLGLPAGRTDRLTETEWKACPSPAAGAEPPVMSINSARVAIVTPQLKQRGFLADFKAY